jgi:hypothetical protein
VNRGEATADTAVGLQVRALPDERLMFGVHHLACGVALPGEGAFDLEIDVAMNVGPGVYRALGFVFDRAANRELARSASILFKVERGPGEYGPVHVAPRMRLVTP